MCEPDLLAREQNRRQRGAHAVEVGLLFHLVGDGGVAFARRCCELAEQIVTRLVVVEMRQRSDHQLRGDLAGGMTTHAIGERKQARAGVHRILVVRTDQTAVTSGRIAQYQGHGRNSITVLPTRTGVPSGTRTAVVTFARSR